MMFKYYLKIPRHSLKLFLIFQSTNTVFALLLSTIWLTTEKISTLYCYLASCVFVTAFFSRLSNDLEVLLMLTNMSSTFHVFMIETAILQ